MVSAEFPQCNYDSSATINVIWLKMKHTKFDWFLLILETQRPTDLPLSAESQVAAAVLGTGAGADCDTPSEIESTRPCTSDTEWETNR